ncbi:MAG: ribose 5-phosphate isomerase B [Candidatus Omnitrophota bacterium]|jgi:ribose 5-phosphate isomerase B
MKKIVIGSDHGGFALKEELKRFLEKKGFKVKDVGAYSTDSCDYPVSAYNVANEVSTGRYRQGLLICKSGIGNSIVANRLPGVCAALCYNAKAARLSREHNDSNVLVMGSLFVNKDSAKRILNIWLNTSFQGGRHQRRLNLLKNIEKGLRSRKR